MDPLPRRAGVPIRHRSAVADGHVRRATGGRAHRATGDEHAHRAAAEIALAEQIPPKKKGRNHLKGAYTSLLALATIDAAGTTLFVGNDEVLAFARMALDTLTFERFVPTTCFPARLAVVGNDRVMTVDHGAIPTLVDAGTGATVSQADQVIGGNAVGVTADGRSVFVGSPARATGICFATRLRRVRGSLRIAATT